MTVTHTIVESPLGELTLVARGASLSGVYFPGHRHRPDPSTFGTRAEDGFDEARRQLTEYFSGARTAFALATAAAGNPFQQRVWALVARIPYGQTTTYRELACELGNPALARAVGAANARNPLSIVVACHRVVGSDGRLTGYGGGLDRKRRLLDLEAGRRDLTPPRSRRRRPPARRGHAISHELPSRWASLQGERPTPDSLAASPRDVVRIA